jgi:hypothetical protein
LKGNKQRLGVGDFVEEGAGLGREESDKNSPFVLLFPKKNKCPSPPIGGGEGGSGGGQVCTHHL